MAPRIKLGIPMYGLHPSMSFEGASKLRNVVLKRDPIRKSLESFSASFDGFTQV